MLRWLTLPVSPFSPARELSSSLERDLCLSRADVMGFLAGTGYGYSVYWIHCTCTAAVGSSQAPARTTTRAFCRCITPRQSASRSMFLETHRSSMATNQVQSPCAGHNCRRHRTNRWSSTVRSAFSDSSSYHLRWGSQQSKEDYPELNNAVLTTTLGKPGERAGLFERRPAGCGHVRLKKDHQDNFGRGRDAAAVVQHHPRLAQPSTTAPPS